MRKSKSKSKTNKTLAVVIINYRTPHDTISCARSIIDHKIVLDPRDIHVVENNSGDDSADVISTELPEVTLLQSPVNGGFGAGVNFGVEHCKHDYIAVLNPDTRFEDNSISEALSLFADPRVGIVGFNLVNEDGSSQHPARTFYSFSTIVLRRTPLKRLGYFKQLESEHLMSERSGAEPSFEAPWVVGAGMILRRSAFVEIGGMDEGYFLYLEDTDICRRMWRANFRVLVASNARLVHSHRRESAKSPISRSNLEHLKSLIYYISKYGIPLLGHDRKN